MPPTIDAGKIQIPLKELKFSFSRSGGPGGQNVNKVNSKVTLDWDAKGSAALDEATTARLRVLAGTRWTNDGRIVLTSQRYRDRGRNTADCIEKLRALVERASHPPKKRKKTRTPRSAHEKRLKEKKLQSLKKKERRQRPDDAL